MPIWSEELLDQYVEDARKDIVNRVNCLFHRFYLATTAGTAVYNLATKVKTVTGVQWRGDYLDEISWIEMEQLSFKDDGLQSIYSQSVPKYYSIHPSNSRAIYLYPTPSESLLATGGDPYSPVKDESRCTISCWAYRDDSVTELVLPDYVERRTIKAHVLSKAFLKDGKGQSLKASDFYNTKYEFLIDLFQRINVGVFLSKRYTLEPAENRVGGRPAGPSLPANFPRVRY